MVRTVLAYVEKLVADTGERALQPRQSRKVEHEIAHMVAAYDSAEEWNRTEAVERLVESCPNELELAAAALQSHRPWKVTRLCRFRAWARSRLGRGRERRERLAEAVLAAYQVDESFVQRSIQAIRDLASAFQWRGAGEFHWMSAYFSSPGAGLMARIVCLGLAAVWNQDECDEPMLWEVGTLLGALASERSSAVVTEVVTHLTAFGLRNLLAGESVDPLGRFLMHANDDAAGNLLDNLVAAERTYRDLTAEGWSPDRLEIENLAMTISMLLRFLAQADIVQEGEVGRRLEITLAEAQQDYRYSGSPFLEADDRKAVEIHAPGWRYRGALLVRPMVREVVD